MYASLCGLSKAQRKMICDIWLSKLPAQQFAGIIEQLNAYISAKLAAASAGFGGAHVLRGLVVLDRYEVF